MRCTRRSADCNQRWLRALQPQRLVLRLAQTLPASGLVRALARLPVLVFPSVAQSGWALEFPVLPVPQWRRPVALDQLERSVRFVVQKDSAGRWGATREMIRRLWPVLYHRQE